MKITVNIYYQTALNKLSQAGTFPLRGRKPEIVAFEWWKDIKKHAYKARLIKVLVNADQDITALVKELENAPIPKDNLPF